MESQQPIYHSVNKRVATDFNFLLLKHNTKMRKQLAFRGQQNFIPNNLNN